VSNLRQDEGKASYRIRVVSSKLSNDENTKSYEMAENSKKLNADF